MSSTNPTTPNRAPAITGESALTAPALIWSMVGLAIIALAVVGSLPVQLLIASVWDGLVEPLRTAPSERAPVSLTVSTLWSTALWTAAFAALAAAAALPYSPRRLALLAGAGTATMVALAGLSLVAHGYWPAVSLPLAMLMGGLTGRVAFEQWQAQLARRRAETRRLVQQSVQQAKAEFLGQLSRDLRTPINAVLGVADLLTETGLDAEQRRHLDVFRRSADSLTHLLEDINDLSRIEAGRIRLRPTAVALVPLIHELVAKAKPQADAKGIQIQLTLSAQLPRLVRADPERLAQVIAELLAHSIRVTRQGRVSVEVRPHSRDPHRIRFAFCDRSLSPETSKVASLVEPFTSAASATRSPAGIGMTLTRRLATLMGGRLSVRQSPGRGSTVVFSAALPAVTAENSPLPTTETASGSASAASATAAPAGPKIAVLLVDDNVSTRQLIESMLDPQQFSVVSCTNGREAMQTLDIAPYDVVLMDLHMPEMDGWAAIRALRRRESDGNAQRTPVIALGSAPFELERQRCLDAGFDEHLCKPLRKSRLIDTLVRLARQTPVHAPPPATAQRTGALRYDQRDSLNLLSSEGLIDVRTAVESLGGDAALYLDAIEHLVPALNNWPQRFRDTLDRNEHDRARQMAIDMQGILEVVGAGACAASLGRMAETLAQTVDAERIGAGLRDLDEHLQPIMQTLQAAVERIRLARQDRARREQGHNSAF